MFMHSYLPDCKTDYMFVMLETTPCGKITVSQCCWWDRRLLHLASEVIKAVAYKVAVLTHKLFSGGK
uniref:Uncharacterized protein n=1 Tax=Anguilla anguilla TaxID=7936 RepID=A0A0E9VC06_ANGAN